MKIKCNRSTQPILIAACFVSILFVTTTAPRASAELPMLNDAPWLGYFAVFANKSFQFSITSKCYITIAPIGIQSGPFTGVPIVFNLVECLPDGKIITHPVLPETLESDQSATDKLEKVVIRGKCSGGASLEVTFEQNHGVILMGGHVTDPGPLKQNPLSLLIHVNFPHLYPYETEKKDEWDRKTKKAFEKKVSQDKIQLKWRDGGRKKQTFEETIDAKSKEYNGPGITTAELQVSAYENRKMVFVASGNSSMSIWNSQTAPLYEGFSIQWVQDAAKDPQGISRLGMMVK